MSKDPKKPRNGNKAPESADYPVGYGKPPKTTQFAKGRSGNPKGRPRKPKEKPIVFSDAPYDSAFREEIYRKLTLRENGVEIELTAQQAIMRARVMSALKGNRFNQKAVLEESERNEQEYLQRKIERYVDLARAKREGERKLAEAKKNNTEPPKLLPHPDDIVLKPLTGDAYVTGPETEEDEKFYEYNIRFRDHLLLRAVHAGIGTVKKKRGDKPKPDFLLSAQILNHVMPERYRWKKKETTPSAESEDHNPRRKATECPPELYLVHEFDRIPRKEREKRIADEFAELRATRPPPSVDLKSKEAKKVARILGRILIKGGGMATPVPPSGGTGVALTVR